MKTKKEFAARRDELKAQVKELAAKYEAARTTWRMTRYADDAAYKEMQKAENEAELAKIDLEIYTLLAGDQPIYANQHFYTDVEPWEVVRIITDRKVVVRKMKATLKEEAKKELQESFVPGGFVGHFDNDAQEWEYTSDENEFEVEIRRHKWGDWHIAGDSTRFYLAEAPRKYYDYNF